jgi:hypothetical protein
MGCALAASSDASDNQLWHEWFGQRLFIDLIHFTSLQLFDWLCSSIFIFMISMLQIRYAFTTDLALNAAYQVSIPPSPGQVNRFFHNTFITSTAIQFLSRFCRLLPVHFLMPHSNLSILLLLGRFPSLVMRAQSFSLL